MMTYYVDVFNSEIIGSDVKFFLYGCNLINYKLIVESKIKRGYEAIKDLYPLL